MKKLLVCLIVAGLCQFTGDGEPEKVTIYPYYGENGEMLVIAEWKDLFDPFYFCGKKSFIKNIIF